MSVKKRNIYKIVIAVVLIGAIAALGFFAYRAGVANGIAQNIDVEALQEGSVPFKRGMHPGMTGFHSGRFSLMRIVGGLFLIFIIIGLVRKLLFRRSFAYWKMHAPGRRYCWDGSYKSDVPPFVAEMHRKMHEDLEKDDAQNNPGDEQVSTE